MIYKNLDLMDSHPIQAVVKVDDSTSGVGEGLEAGCWAIGVSRSNYMDIDSFKHEAQLSDQGMTHRHAYSKDVLRKTGAHYVIDSVADLAPVIDDIHQRLARGERP